MKTYSTLFLALLAALSLKAQEPLRKSTYLSVGFGLSNYLGDLGGNTGVGKRFFYDNNFKKRTFFYGVGFSYYWRERLGVRFELSGGKLAGSDQDAVFTSVTDNSYYRLRRNLDFQTRITEGALLVQLQPLKFISTQNRWHHFSVQPYLGFGLGLFSFNPQGSYFDEIADDYVWVDLQPLRTEGQGMKEYPGRKPYQLTQWNLPMVIGFSYVFSPKTSLSFEFMGRKLFTDYLDDVSTNYIDPSLFEKYMNPEDAEVARAVSNKSNLINPDMAYRAGDQRGNPKKKDFYYTFSVRFSIRLTRMKSTPTAGYKKDKPFFKYDDLEMCQ